MKKRGPGGKRIRIENGKLITYLFVRFFQVFHKDSNHNIDQNELSHEDKNHKEKWCKVGRNATVAQTIITILAFFA